MVFGDKKAEIYFKIEPLFLFYSPVGCCEFSGKYYRVRALLYLPILPRCINITEFLQHIASVGLVNDK